MGETEDRVKHIISGQLGLRNIENTDSIEDLGGDSIDIAEITMTIDSELKVKIPFEDMSDAVKVADVINLVRQRLNR